MTIERNANFGDLHQWQAMLDRYAELFSEMAAGARVGFVSRADSGMLPGKHVAGARLAQGGEILSWERQGEGMCASLKPFTGINDAPVDLLFVVEDEALGVIRDSLVGDALGLIKRQIRRGGIMFYVMKNKYQLLPGLLLFQMKSIHMGAQNLEYHRLLIILKLESKIRALAYRRCFSQMMRN